MKTIYVDIQKSTKKQIAKILQLLNTKFHGYHDPEALKEHSLDYGILAIVSSKAAFSTKDRSLNKISLQQFFKKYGSKPISFKEIM